MSPVVFSLSLSPQRLEAEIIVGHQLLQGLLCHAVESMEKETAEKRYVMKKSSKHEMAILNL